MKTQKLGAIVGLLVAVSLMAGCAGAQTPTATSDPKLIYTQVALTVQAQINAASSLTPQATSTTMPTDVPTATATLGTVVATDSGTTAPSLGTGTPAATALPGTPAATLASTAGPVVTSAVLDKMLYVSQTVADGTKFTAGTTFTQSWTIQNVGPTTWDNTYTIRFFGGTRLGVQDFPLPQSVKPQASVTLTVHMTAPDTVGQYTSVWVITNPQGANFGSFNFLCEVK